MFCFLLLVYFLSGSMGSDVLSRHKRAWIINSFEIEEECPGPFPFVLGEIDVNREYPIFFELSGEGVDEEPKGVISIDRNSGTLHVHRPVDYEEKTLLKLKFEAKKIDQSSDTKIGVEIQIRDINDNPPRFEMDVYEVSVKGETTQGTSLLAVNAYDRDQSGTANSTFNYEIKSVSPNIPDTEFLINEHGAISFKGCLNSEVAEKVTILVEARDHGEVVSLSSSTTVVIHIQDSNLHRPIVSGKTGSSRVKEGETGSSPLRLHVTDEDTPNTAAWRTKYTIHGDEGQHFKIETDPRTNDGVLTVIKPLDFEQGSQKTLSISVENESPHFSCKVKEKSSSGLWKVDTQPHGQPHSVEVIVEIEDVNDPPVFSVSDKEAVLEENAPVGTWVEKLTAVDPDSKQASGIIYKVGYDPAGWMTVDPKTGNITTVTIPDRESPHVENGIYTFLLHAVDEGEPSMTATATLHIHVKDQNDNVPQLATDHVSICFSDTTSITNITAFDADANPLGGPFKFELLGDDKEKWALDPSFGFTAGLLKKSSVYAGPHVIRLKIYDIQGMFGVYDLNATVCDCSVTRDCRIHRITVTKAHPAAIGIALASLLLLLVLLLAVVVVSRKKEFTSLETSDCSSQSLEASNFETQGTDCQVFDKIMVVSSKQQTLQEIQRKPVSLQSFQRTWKNEVHNNNYYNHEFENKKSGHEWSQRAVDATMDALIGTDINQYRKTSNQKNSKREVHRYQNYEFENENSGHEWSQRAVDATLAALIGKKLALLQVTEHVAMDNSPHLYANEGSSCNMSEFDELSFS
ncbi:cadherin-like protein 26 isoform X2 [Gouania willdenowi]|uniref:cadherin-like protein 26 isoform X2 n=1 Tax=Gouania willdenowi TaxID=441366 RepID=UPI001056ACC1|nr:cadherin-like protein 26 isoform X2 [Gouania willdenowi]